MLGALKAIKGYYDYGIFQAVQIAAIVALRHGEPGRLAQVAEYQSRRDALVRGLKRTGWVPESPKAGMFVWTADPRTLAVAMGSIDFAMKLLEDANVVVSPGRAFGETGEGFLRLALVENAQRLRQAVRQLARCLRPENAAAIRAVLHGMPARRRCLALRMRAGRRSAHGLSGDRVDSAEDHSPGARLKHAGDGRA